MIELKNIFDQLFEEIKHGDQEHQDWLKKKLDDFLINYESSLKEKKIK